ncbi:hypothetical protein [Propionibacterium australiense]|uniref:Uncharacterized protein n=1 Tax=Propionibacterium australiense TaxID=119981 RepID=A0A8B3FPW3_9ACTN|nr:hypothetical protein [Propionibacterium australiense]RLP11033.1 hypothetical protein D9T14_04670 [Propionibacterium australiense]RLP13001.1 hypothetical protein D7U36_00795 [Propionibacterium australiense]VEH91026.1 Uncharacterised protein [Propionibacterium australiense]
MSFLLIPRLSTSEAHELLLEHSGVLGGGAPPDSLVRLDVQGTPNPTGGAAASPSDLERWRQGIVERVGGIDARSREGRDELGVQLGRAIQEIICPIPADAAHDGTWSYLALVVFPDVVNRRWPGEWVNGQFTLPAERWIGRQTTGRDRNYLKLAWRRWVVLGEVMSEARPLLGEDEFGALLERTAVARNKRLVVAAARVIIQRGPGYPGGRMEFARQLMKRIAARTGPLLLDIRTDDELMDVVIAEADACFKSVQYRGARRAAV